MHVIFKACNPTTKPVSPVHRRQQSFSSSSSPANDGGDRGGSNGSPPTSPPPAASPSFAKLQLEGQDEILDVVACPAPAGLFELRSQRHSHVILASGVSPALAFYPIGSESRSFGLASIAWAVASRVTSLTVGALDGLFGFVGLRGRGRKAAASARSRSKSGEGGEGGNGGGEDEGSPAPLVLRWDGGLQDGWRRVSRLCLDPSGRLAAAADGFGRVMLVDCATRQVRYLQPARCGVVHEAGWSESRGIPFSIFAVGVELIFPAEWIHVRGFVIHLCSLLSLDKRANAEIVPDITKLL